MTPVPCNGCRACCLNDALILHPEMGDDPEQYGTDEIVNPLTGKPALKLKNKPNGECVYLGKTGCTIYDRRPAICAEFDCAEFVRRTGKKVIALMLRRGLASKTVVKRGKELLARRRFA